MPDPINIDRRRLPVPVGGTPVVPVGTNIPDGYRSVLPITVPQPVQAIETPGPWKRFWGQSLGQAPFTGLHTRNQATLSSMTSNQREAADKAVFYSHYGLFSEYAAMSPSIQRETDRSVDEAVKLGVTPAQFNAVFLHQGLLSDEARKRNILMGAAVGGAAAFVAAPVIAAGVAAAGVGGATATLLTGIGTGIVGGAPSVLPSLIEFGAPGGHGGGQFTLKEAGEMALDFGADFGVGLAGIGWKAIPNPLKRGAFSGIRSALDPFVSPILSPLSRAPAYQSVLGRYNQLMDPVLRRRVAEGATSEYILPHATVRTKEEARENISAIIERLPATLDPKRISFSGTDEFAFTGTEVPMTYARLARTRLEELGYFLPGADKTYKSTFDELAEDLANQFYMNQKARMAATEDHQRVLAEARELLVQQLPQTRIKGDSAIAATNIRARWKEEEDMVANLRAGSRQTGDPEFEEVALGVADILEQRIKDSKRRSVEAYRTAKSNIYVNQMMQDVQSYAPTVLRDPTVFDEQIQTATAKLVDEVKRDAFQTGMQDPRLGISSIVTPKLEFSSTGNITDLAKSFSGRPQALALSMVDEADPHFRAIINIDAQERNMPYLLAWLKRSGLYIEDAFGPSVDKDLAVIVTSDKSREGFYSYWKHLGLNVDITKPDGSTVSFLEESGLELFSKRSGLARSADIVGSSEIVPVLGKEGHMHLQTEHMDLMLGMIDPNPRSYVEMRNRVTGELQIVDYHESMKDFMDTDVTDLITRQTHLNKVLEANRLSSDWDFSRLSGDGKKILMGNFSDAGSIMAASTYKAKLTGAYESMQKAGLISHDLQRQQEMLAFRINQMYDRTGHATFALTHTLDLGIHKSDVQVVSDEHFSAMQQYLVRAGLLKDVGEAPDIIGSMMSLKTGYSPTRGEMRIVLKPSSHSDEFGNYHVMNAPQQMPVIESILGPALTKSLIQPIFQAFRHANWEKAKFKLMHPELSQHDHDYVHSRAYIAARNKMQETRGTHRDFVGKNLDSDELQIEAYEYARKRMEETHGVGRYDFDGYDDEFDDHYQDFISGYAAEFVNRERIYAEEHSKYYSEAAQQYLEELKVSQDLGSGFLKNAMRKGVFGISQFRMYASAMSEAVSRAGVGDAPAGVMPGMRGALLPAEYFGYTQHKSISGGIEYRSIIDDQDHVGLAFSESNDFLGFVPHEKDAASWEFIRGLEGPDADDHPFGILLQHGSEYFMVMLRDPVVSGLVRRVNRDQAQKFIQSTGTQAVNVPEGTMIRRGLNSGNLDPNELVPWSFDLIRGGMSREINIDPLDLPRQTDIMPSLSPDNPIHNMYEIAKYNKLKGAVGIVDTLNRLMIMSGVEGRYRGSIFSDTIDDLARYLGGTEEGARVYKEDIRVWLEADPSNKLDEYMFQRYPHLKRSLEEYFEGKGSTIPGGIPMEPKRRYLADEWKEAVLGGNVAEGVHGVLVQGSLQALSASLDPAVLELARQVSQKAGRVHTHYRNRLYEGLVEGKELTKLREEIINKEGLGRALDMGHSSYDFIAAMMQVAALEVSAGRRKGTRSAISTELLELIDQRAMLEFFDATEDYYEPALRIEFDTGRLGRELMDLTKNYKVQGVVNSEGLTDFYMGISRYGTFNPLQKIPDRQIGAIAEAAGGLQFGGRLRASVGRSGVAEQGYFKLRDNIGPGGEWQDVERISRNLIEAERQRLAKLKEFYDEQVANNVIEQSKVSKLIEESQIFNLDELSKGLQAPIGILSDRVTTVTDSGIHLSVRGHRAVPLSPEEVRIRNREEQRIFVFDIENDWKKILHNRELADVAQFGGYIIDQDGNIIENIRMSFNELQRGELRNILSGVTDIGGYNVSHDMDIMVRDFGMNFDDKVVIDLRQAYEAAGVVNDMIAKSHLRAEGGFYTVPRLTPQDVSKGLTLEDVTVQGYWGDKLGESPLKGRGGLTEVLGLSRGEMDVNALELSRALFRDPRNREIVEGMDWYHETDIAQTALLYLLARRGMPEQFGDFGSTNVVGKTWEDVGKRPAMYRYEHVPDVNDAYKMELAPFLEDGKIDPLDALTGEEYLSSVNRARREGQNVYHLPLLRAWGGYFMNSPSLGSAASVGMRGVAQVGYGLSKGAGWTFGNIGRGVGWGVGQLGAPGRRIRDEAREALASSAYVKLRGEVRSDVLGETPRGAVTEGLFDESDWGEHTRVFQPPGIRTHTSPVSNVIGVGVSGVQFMAGWWLGGGVLGRLWDAPTAFARAGTLKGAEALKLRLQRDLQNNPDLSEFARAVASNDEISPSQLLVLRDDGEFNDILRDVYDIDSAAYELLHRRLEQLGQIGEWNARLAENGAMQYGYKYGLWNRATRGFSKKIAADPDKYEQRMRELRRDSERYMEAAKAKGFDRDVRERIIDRAMPWPQITEDMPNYAELMARARDSGRIDLIRDFDLLTTEQKINLRGLAEARGAFMDDLVTARRIPQMSSKFSTPWIKEDGTKELRSGAWRNWATGGPLDPEEWRRAGNWRSWMPDRGWKKSILFAMFPGSWAATGAYGAAWETARWREFGDQWGEGYDPWWNMFMATDYNEQSRKEEIRFNTMSRSIPVLRNIPNPLPRIGEYAFSPRRGYARQHNVRERQRAIEESGYMAQLMNEEASYYNTPLWQAIGFFHPGNLAKFSMIPIDELGQYWSTVTLPWKGHEESFRQGLQKHDLSSLPAAEQVDPTLRQFYGLGGKERGRMWESVRKGDLNVVPDAVLRTALEEYKKSTSARDYRRTVNRLESYMRTVRQGTTDENTERLARYMGDDWRRISALQIAGDRFSKQDEGSADLWHQLWLGLRTVYGHHYDYKEGSYEEEWRSGTRQAWAEDYDYNRFAGDFVTYGDMGYDPSMKTILKRILRHLQGPFRKAITYERPGREGTDIFKIPGPKPTSSMSPNVLQDMLQNVTSEMYGSQMKVNPLTVPQLGDPTYIQATPGGTLVNVGERGYDEIMIPLDQSVLAHFFRNMGSGGTQDSEELRKIAQEIHDVARVLGGFEVTVGKAVYEISASNKGMGEAIHLASTMERQIVNTGRIDSQATMRFMGVPGADIVLPTSGNFQGQASNLPFWQDFKQDRLTEMELGLVPANYAPFAGKDRATVMPQWSTGYNPVTGLHGMDSWWLSSINFTDPFTSANYANLYSQDAMTAAANVLSSQARDPLTGVDRERLVANPELRDGEFYAERDQHTGAYYSTAYDNRGNPIAIPYAAGIDSPLPANLLPAAAYKSGTIRPDIADLFGIDADTLKLIMSPLQTRQSGPGMPTILSEVLVPQGADKYELSTFPQYTRADIEANPAKFNELLQLHTESIRLTNMDTPEEYEPLGMMSNVVMWDMIADLAKDRRFFIDIESGAAGNQDPWGAGSRLKGRAYGMTGAGRELELGDTLLALGLTRDIIPSKDAMSTVGRRLIRARAESEELHLHSQAAYDAGLGPGEYAQDAWAADKTLIREAMSRPGFYSAGSRYIKTASGAPISLTDWTRIEQGTGPGGQPVPLSDLPQDIEIQHLTLESLLADVVSTPGIDQKGHFNIAQLVDHAVATKDALVADPALAVLYAMQSDDPDYAEFREEMVKPDTMEHQAAVQASGLLSRTLSGSPGWNLSETYHRWLPKDLSMSLFGSDKEVALLPGQGPQEIIKVAEELREDQTAEIEKNIKTTLDDYFDQIGVSGDADRAIAFRAAGTIEDSVRQKIAALTAAGTPPTPEEQSTIWREAHEEEYLEQKDLAEKGEIREATEDFMRKQHKARVSAATSNINQTHKFFDPYAKDLDSDELESAFEALSPEALTSFMTAGRLTGIGSAEDMFQTIAQYTATSDAVRADPVTWDALKATGHAKFFAGGYTQDMATVMASNWANIKMGRDLNVVDPLSPSDANTLISTLGQQFGLSSGQVSSLQGLVSTGGLDTEADAVIAVFREMFNAILGLGRSTVNNLSRQFAHPELQSDASGNVMHVTQMPADYNVDLRRMAEAGTGVEEVYIPGKRYSYEVARGREVDPESATGELMEGSGVWEVGGGFYEYTAAPDRYAAEIAQLEQDRADVSLQIQRMQNEIALDATLDPWDQMDPADLQNMKNEVARLQQREATIGSHIEAYQAYDDDVYGDTLRVVENVTRKLEEKEIDGKWYTYVDGKWDGADPTAEEKGLPKETIHGTRESLYDVKTGRLIRQSETYEGVTTTLLEGEPITDPGVTLPGTAALQNMGFSGGNVNSLIASAMFGGFDIAEVQRIAQEMLNRLGLNSTLVAKLLVMGMNAGWSPDEVLAAAETMQIAGLTSAQMAALYTQIINANWDFQEFEAAMQKGIDIGVTGTQLANILIKGVIKGWTSNDLIKAMETLVDVKLTSTQVAEVLDAALTAGWTSADVISAAKELVKTKYGFTAADLSSILLIGMESGWTKDEVLSLALEAADHGFTASDLANIMNTGIRAGWEAQEVINFVKEAADFGFTVADMAAIMDIGIKKNWSATDVYTTLQELIALNIHGAGVGEAFAEAINAGWSIDDFKEAFRRGLDLGLTPEVIGELVTKDINGEMDSDAILTAGEKLIDMKIDSAVVSQLLTDHINGKTDIVQITEKAQELIDLGITSDVVAELLSNDINANTDAQEVIAAAASLEAAGISSSVIGQIVTAQTAASVNDWINSPEFDEWLEGSGLASGSGGSNNNSGNNNNNNSGNNNNNNSGNNNNNNSGNNNNNNSGNNNNNSGNNNNTPPVSDLTRIAQEVAARLGGAASVFEAIIESSDNAGVAAVATRRYFTSIDQSISPDDYSWLISKYGEYPDFPNMDNSGHGGDGTEFAEGGYVQPRPGGVRAIVAEAGEPEAILPLSKVPDIFAKAFAQSQSASRSMANTAQQMTSGVTYTNSASMAGSSSARDVDGLTTELIQNLTKLLENLGVADSSIAESVAEQITAIYIEGDAAVERIHAITQLLGEADADSEATIGAILKLIDGHTVEAEQTLRGILLSLGDISEDDAMVISEQLINISANALDTESRLKLINDILGDSAVEGDSDTVNEQLARILESELHANVQLAAVLDILGVDMDSVPESVQDLLKAIITSEETVNTQLLGILSIIGESSVTGTIGSRMDNVNLALDALADAIQAHANAVGEWAVVSGGNNQGGNNSNSSGGDSSSSSSSSSGGGVNTYGRTILAGDPVNNPQGLVTIGDDGGLRAGATQYQVWASESGTLYRDPELTNPVHSDVQSSWDRDYKDEYLESVPNRVDEQSLIDYVRSELEKYGFGSIKVDQIASNLATHFASINYDHLSAGRFNEEMTAIAEDYITRHTGQAPGTPPPAPVDNPTPISDFRARLEAANLDPDIINYAVRDFANQINNINTTGKGPRDIEAEQKRIADRLTAKATEDSEKKKAQTKSSDDDDDDDDSSSPPPQPEPEPEPELDDSVYEDPPPEEVLGNEDDTQSDPFGVWEGGVALPTTGGIPALVAERGEAEAILPISKVPDIFARSIASSMPAMKSIIKSMNDVVRKGWLHTDGASLDYTFEGFDAGRPAPRSGAAWQESDRYHHVLSMTQQPSRVRMAPPPISQPVIHGMKEMELAMSGITESYRNDVNVSGDGIIVIENHVTLEVGGEEFANAIITSDRYTKRSGRGDIL